MEETVQPLIIALAATAFLNARIINLSNANNETKLHYNKNYFNEV